jgi:hypothetical protein
MLDELKAIWQVEWARSWHLLKIPMKLVGIGLAFVVVGSLFLIFQFETVKYLHPLPYWQEIIVTTIDLFVLAMGALFMIAGNVYYLFLSLKDVIDEW